MGLRLLLLFTLLQVSNIFSAQVSLTGKVTFSDGTTPVSGITIAVPTDVEQVEVVTDVIGQYSLSIEEGTYDELRVRSMGSDIDGIPNMMEFQAVAPLVVSGNTVVDVTLNAMPKISGTVRDGDGTILPNAKVEVITYQNSMTDLPYDEDNVDSTGAYEVWNETGTLQVTVRPPEGSALPNYVFTFEHTADTILDIQFPSLLKVSGTVTSHKGDTVKGVTVALVKDNNQTETTTDSLGYYEFLISEGTVSELRVRSMGSDIEYVPNMMEYQHKTDFAVTADVTEDITLPVIHMVMGVLYTSDSTPLNGATMSSATWDGSMNGLPSDESTTDSFGAFKLFVADGETQLRIRPQEGSGLADEEKILTITSDTTLALYLSESSVLSGKVLYYDSLPIAGITLALSNGQGQRETTTDMDGNFSISVEPGLYGDFRVRSMGHTTDSIPTMMEYTVDSAGVDLTESVSMDIVMPKFMRLSGTIMNSMMSPISNITVRSAAWYEGMNGLPTDEATSQMDGKFELYMQEGINEIVVTSDGSEYATTVFTIDMVDHLEKDIILTDQAKGVARIQPSVISQGKSGKILVTGVNSSFTDGVSAIDLGEGVTVSNIEVLSDISLSAEIVITENATPSSRPVIVTGESDTYVGAELFRITAPVKESAVLDSESKLKVTIVINDGTGTEIVIDSGTLVIFPDGVVPEIKFDAPIISNDTINPDSATFLQIQREFYPEGVTFDPPAKITFFYQDQDVEGINEDSLKAYKYDNETDSVIGEYTIIEKDTSENWIKQEAPTFSLYRLAVSGGSTPIVNKKTLGTEVTLVGVQSGSDVLVRFTVPQSYAGEKVSLQLYNVQGRVIRTLKLQESVAGVHVVPLTKVKTIASGIYYLDLHIGEKKLTKPLRVR